MSRELYESIQKGEADSGAEGLLGAFVQVLTRVRQEQAGGLAQSEYEEGLWVEENEAWLDADLDDLSLAARDGAERDFPVRYRGKGLVVLLGLGEDGEPYLLLEEGEGPVEVLGLVLEKGIEQACQLDAPPVELVLASGEILRP